MTLLMAAGSGFAQLNDFNLSDYKLPRLERRTLETHFNLHGNNIQREFISSADQPSDVNAFNSNASIAYHYYLNSEQWQRDIRTSVSLSYSYDKRELWDDLLSRSSGLHSIFSTDLLNRYYFDTNRFVELNLFADYNPRYLSDYSNSYSAGGTFERDYNSSGHFVKITPSIKAGVGRIEPVQDARHAVYILEELARIARVSPDKSSEEILAFAQLISELKNERFFDSRLKRNFELEQLDSFLLANNYILEYDATYIATLADYWAFGGTPERLSGQRISAALIPSLDYWRININNIMPDYSENNWSLAFIGIYGGAEYVREKPLNLTWQNTIDVAAYFGWVEFFEKENEGDYSLDTRIPHFQMSASQTIGYYPSTRTSATLGYGIQYIRFFDGSDEANNIYGVEGNGIRAGIGLNLNYYFSPQLRLNVNSNLDYMWHDSEEYLSMDYFLRPGESRIAQENFNNPYTLLKSHLDHRFIVGLIYSIF